MAKNECATCKWEKKTGRQVDSSRSNVSWGKKIGVSEAGIRRHLKHPKDGQVAGPVGAEGGIASAEKLSETWTGTQGEMSVVISGEEISKEAILRKFGHDPENVYIVGTLEESHWMMSGEWQHRYRFRTERLQRDHAIDPVGILSKLRSKTQRLTRKHSPSPGDPSTFVLSINDTQLGQGYNGGSEATLKEFHKNIELVKLRIAELRSIGRSLDSMLLILGGDLVEGCFIYPHQAFNIDLNRKEQIEAVVAMILHALDELAPMFSDVRVLACRGNHGENRVGGKKTALSDNDDTLAVEMAKLAVSRDSSMSHISEWTIARDEAAVWADVHGWTVVTTHGDIYAKGVSGATTERKAHQWLKNMASSRGRFGKLGDADLLVTHHFHHDEMKDWGDTLWRQTPSQDRGSPEFSQATGTHSAPGMLTFVVTPERRYQDEHVVR